MILTKNYLLIKFFFICIWLFFIFRISSFINPFVDIVKFHDINLINFLTDSLSIIILISLFTYILIFLIKKKKISYIFILIIYPIFGLIGCLINYELHLNNSLILHQFITSISLFLFLAIIDSEKIFDDQFKKLLLKIILFVILIYILFIIIPKFYFVLFNNKSIRSGDFTEYSFLNNQINFGQNVNGLGRILFILQLLSLFIFKKFILNKKILAHLFFFIAVFLVTIIFLLQSRFNLIASFLFSFFLLFNIKNLHFIRKIFYYFAIIIIPILIFKLYSLDNNRFFNKNISSKSLTTDLTINWDFLGAKIKNQKNLEILSKLNKIEKKFREKKFLNSNDYLILLNMQNEINKIDSKISKDYQLLKKYIDYLVGNYNFYILQFCSPALSYLDSMVTGRICGWEILLKNFTTVDLIFGKGYFSDQIILNTIQKTSSNSWINILFNAGIISLFIFAGFIILFFFKFFYFKNTNHKNIYFSISHYFFLYFLARSIFEDTLAFVSIDLLMLSICMLLIKETVKKK